MMNLDTPPRNLDGVREMKVKIPLRLHISLHGLKLLSGRQLSDIVTEALTAYMSEQAAQREENGPAARDGAPRPLPDARETSGPTAGY